MKILIVGDFSSAGHFLAMGLRNLGCKVTHVAYQNGWRENPIEINLTSPYKGPLGKIHNYIRPFSLTNIKGYDHVLFLDYFPFPRSFGINSIITKRIKDSNKSCSLWVMGCDSKMYEFGVKIDSMLCKSCLQFDQLSEICKCQGDRKSEKLFLEGISNIFPACYEYFMAHQGDKRLRGMIQLPVPLADISNSINQNRKINIFHGLNRYGFKGTFIVESVFDRLKFSHGSLANFLIKGKLNFTEYSSLMESQDVVVDQMFNKSLGINSLMTLSMGKILIAGDPQLACDLIDAPRPPMLSIDSTEKSLRESLEIVLNDFSRFSYLFEEGREYISKYHSPTVVAMKLLNSL